jgi:hypothetical protein
MADVRMAPGPAAVVARARPPPAQARITAEFSGNDRGAAVPHDDQAVGGERLQGVPDDAGPDALPGLTSVIDGNTSPGPMIPDRMASVSVTVTCCQAGRGSRGLIVSMLNWEPVSGFEPLACRLQEVRPRAPCALAAQMARVIALTTLAALGLSDDSSHEPFLAQRPDV